MREYIHSYNSFFENINFESDSDSIRIANDKLNDLKSEISDFNSKKSNLENLIVNNVGEDKKDITRDIDNIVKENRFLSRYVTILNKKRRLREMELRLDYYSNLLEERKGNLSQTSKLTDEADRREQRDNINEQIKNTQDSIKKIKDDYKEVEKEIKEDLSNFKDYMKDLEDDAKETIQKTSWNMKT